LIYNSKAIVLNKLNYGNTSLICNLFTAEQGKISIIAKGARSKKNIHSAVLQPANFIELIYYYKDRRNIQTLKEASIINNYYNLKKSYDKLLCSLVIVDLINKISLQNNPCDIIFRLTEKTLAKINLTKDENIKIYYIFFQIQLLIYLGYQPSFSRCYKCNKNVLEGYYNAESGQFECIKCILNKKYQINQDMVKIINYFMKTHIDKLVTEFNFERKLLININIIMHKFILYHLPELRKSKIFNNYE